MDLWTFRLLLLAAIALLVAIIGAPILNAVVSRALASTLFSPPIPQLVVAPTDCDEQDKKHPSSANRPALFTES